MSKSSIAFVAALGTMLGIYAMAQPNWDPLAVRVTTRAQRGGTNYADRVLLLNQHNVYWGDEVLVSNGMNMVRITTNGVTILRGGVSAPIDVANTVAFPVTKAHSTVVLNGLNNAVEADLPTAVGIAGRIYTLKATNITFACTVDPAGTEEIDGASASFTFGTQYERITIQSDGSNWMRID